MKTKNKTRGYAPRNKSGKAPVLNKAVSEKGIKLIILLLLFAPITGWTQETEEQPEVGSISFGDYTVEYDQEFQAEEGAILYYKNDNLVLSAFDSNQDGVFDSWLRFGQNGELDLEAYDSDYDKIIDTVNEIENDRVSRKVKEPEFLLEEVEITPDPDAAGKPVNREEKQEAKSQPEAFSLNPPPEKNKMAGRSMLKWFFVIGGACLIGYWYWRKNYKK